MTRSKTFYDHLPRLEGTTITLHDPPTVTHTANGSNKECTRLLVWNPSTQSAEWKIFFAKSIGNNQYELATITPHGFTPK